MSTSSQLDYIVNNITAVNDLIIQRVKYVQGIRVEVANFRIFIIVIFNILLLSNQTISFRSSPFENQYRYLKNLNCYLVKLEWVFVNRSKFIFKNSIFIYFYHGENDLSCISWQKRWISGIFMTYFRIRQMYKINIKKFTIFIHITKQDLNYLKKLKSL